MSTKRSDNHWLVHPRTLRWLAIVGCIILGLTVAAQAVIKVKGYFEIDSWFGFGAVFGFLCCVVLVLLARVLGRFLKRGEHYYDD